MLYLNDEPVGDVVVLRTEDSWSHGTFLPGEGFSKYAPVFGRWSLLMHADAGGGERLSAAASEELRRTEYEIDRLRAKLHFRGKGEWVTCAQLNIDGPLIEWKTV